MTRVALLNLKFKQIVWSSHQSARRSDIPPLSLSILHATERSPPKGRKPIEWKLITDLADMCAHVRTKIEKINWYAMRWKIETFHKILKSGCRAEDFRLAHSEPARQFDGSVLHPELARLVVDDDKRARAAPEEPPSIALTGVEIGILDDLVADAGNRQCRKGGQVSILHHKARPSGRLSRARQRSATRHHRHLARFLALVTDIELGAEIGAARELWVIESNLPRLQLSRAGQGGH